MPIDNNFEMWWKQHAVLKQYAQMDSAIEELARDAAEAAWQAKELFNSELPRA